MSGATSASGVSPPPAIAMTPSSAAAPSRAVMARGPARCSPASSMTTSASSASAAPPGRGARRQGQRRARRRRSPGCAPRADHRQRDHQRQMRVEVDLRRHQAAADLRRVEQVEVHPPQAARRREGAGGRERGRDSPVDARRLGDRGHDRLAEDDQREEAEALGEVARMQGRRLEDRARGGHRRAQLDDHRDPPQHVAGRAGEGQRGQPHEQGEREALQVAPEQRGRLGRGSPRAFVEAEEDQPHGGVGEDEARRVAGRGEVDVDGQRRHGEHRRQHRHAEDGVVGVEAVGVDGEADPRPPHGHEQSRAAQGARQRRVVMQQVAELGDRDDEHEVEEQFRPRRVPLGVGVLKRAQPRRDEQVSHACNSSVTDRVYSQAHANARRRRTERR